MTVALASSTAPPRTHVAVLLILALTHLLNDLVQSLIPAVYPIITSPAIK